MNLADIEKLEQMATEHELISDKAFGHGSAKSGILGLEKHRKEADHLRSVCKELKSRAEY